MVSWTMAVHVGMGTECVVVELVTRGDVVVVDVVEDV
jgi:hypothetical protein